ncbi:MAG: hypothetical protein ACOCXJ_08005 [Planctomycetota bacterium]
MRLPLLILVAIASLSAADRGEDYRFTAMPLATVIDSIAADGDLNVVYAPSTLAGISVTVQLEDVQPLAALRAVVHAAGCRYEQVDGAISVVRPSLRQELQDCLRLLQQLQRELPRD